MKTFIFFITIAIICSIQEFVNAFNIWSHFIENNKEEKNIIENGKGLYWFILIFHILVKNITYYF